MRNLNLRMLKGGYELTEKNSEENGELYPGTKHSKNFKKYGLRWNEYLCRLFTRSRSMFYSKLYNQNPRIGF